MSRIRIETAARKPDFRSLLPLIREEWPHQFGPPTDERMVQVMEDSYDHAADVIRVAIMGSDPVAFYRFTRWPRASPSWDNVHLLDIAVDPKFQRLGLGRLLFADLLLCCTRRRTQKVLSRTFEDNRASAMFHQRMGFRLLDKSSESLVWERNVSMRRSQP